MTDPQASRSGTDNPPTGHGSFFRQSGWLMLANVVGGALMWAVHFLNKFIPPGEYGSFGALLAVVMLLPTLPVQMVLAQQTAQAIATRRERAVAGVIHAVWLVTTLVWLVGAVVVLGFQDTILARWHMNSPAGLWITLVIVLLSLWLPMFWGVLQGQQNFLWLGWSMLASGFGRLAVAVLAVLVLRVYAAGMMAGVLLGTALGVGLAAWQTRRLWWLRAEPYEARAVWRQIIPLALGFLGFQILFTGDTILVKAWFSQDQVDFYVSAGTLSRALLWLVLPLAAVMFPRLVHSAARAEKSDLSGKVLLATVALALVGAAALALLGPWVVRLVYKPEFVAVASALLPWYAGAMVPLAAANVLLNQLLARPAASLVPAVCVLGLAIAYVVALSLFHDRLVTVLQVMGLSNVALLGVCGWFAWRAAALRRQSEAPAR